MTGHKNSPQSVTFSRRNPDPSLPFGMTLLELHTLPHPLIAHNPALITFLFRVPENRGSEIQEDKE